MKSAANSSAPLLSYPVPGLRGETTVPGDKSISHRALMIASCALGTTQISGLLEGEDVLNSARALQYLGVPIARFGQGLWEVQGVGVGGLKESSAVLDMGNSGTGARLLMGLVATHPFATFFTGDASLTKRPMGRVTEPLTQMGARFLSRDGNRLPLAVSGASNPMPITYKLPMPSAQVKSAILFAGLNTRGTTTVIEPEATRDHTENMLGYFGFEVKRDGNTISLDGHQNPARANRSFEVPGDPSSAAFLVVSCLVTPQSSITIKNICVNPLRTGLFTTLKEMGAAISFLNPREVGGEQVADIQVKSGKLRGITVPASRAPSMIDEYPILAVAAAFAEGETVMEGLSELKVKESDRLLAIATGLAACGVKAKAEGDTLCVTGSKKPRGGATIESNLDHRIAMSFLVLGMGAEQPVSVDEPGSIATSFPGFAELMNRLGARMSSPAPSAEAKPIVIAIDGPAASGKGTLARRLAEYFDLTYLDTGSLYRAVGLKLEYADKDPHDKEAAIAAAKSIDATDLANPRLRQERVGTAASVVSAMPEIRAILLDFQRNFGKQGKGAVLDGRDIGTVVFPEADFKFYLTASLAARARRRHRELSGQGIEVVYDSVLEDLTERDARDAQREIAPMKPAQDAVVIDTSNMDANSVFEKVKRLIEQRPDGRKTA